MHLDQKDKDSKVDSQRIQKECIQSLKPINKEKKKNFVKMENKHVTVISIRYKQASQV